MQCTEVLLKFLFQVKKCTRDKKPSAHTAGFEKRRGDFVLFDKTVIEADDKAWSVSCAVLPIRNCRICAIMAIVFKHSKALAGSLG